MDGRMAAADRTVCFCGNVTKEQIVEAIAGGAETLEEIAMATGACRGKQKKKKNPSGRCCCEDIQALIDAYLPIFKTGGNRGV